METQIITIPVHTDIDPSLLLEIAIELAMNIENEIESHGGEGRVMEEEVSVEAGDDSIYGGEGE